MQFFKSENWFDVREALIQAGRRDLIGSGCDCLISPKLAGRGHRSQAPTRPCATNTPYRLQPGPEGTSWRTANPDASGQPGLSTG